MTLLRERLHTSDCEHPVREPDEPSDYLAWQEWVEEKAKTCHQERCPYCGLYAIWRPNESEAPV